MYPCLASSSRNPGFRISMFSKTIKSIRGKTARHTRLDDDICCDLTLAPDDLPPLHLSHHEAQHREVRIALSSMWRHTLHHSRSFPLSLYPKNGRSSARAFAKNRLFLCERVLERKLRLRQTSREPSFFYHTSRLTSRRDTNKHERSVGNAPTGHEPRRSRCDGARRLKFEVVRSAARPLALPSPADSRAVVERRREG